MSAENPAPSQGFRPDGSAHDEGDGDMSKSKHRLKTALLGNASILSSAITNI